MKRWVVTAMAFLLGLNFTIFSQQQGPRDGRGKADFEAFKQKRVAFITDAMGLSEDEAKDFWPLCNELSEKKFQLNRELNRAMREFNAKKEHTEAEYKQIVTFCCEQRVKEAKLEREYMEKFAAVIPSAKVYLYWQAEQQFARKMLDEMNKRNRGKNEKDTN
ncbi:MAG: hypothetical protein LBR64_09035 [Dysgonamonadaceae bacterium]|nr:hypothetical protein [Dysgonamonadaceae bacterium]